jgi:hypothetical protein
MVLALASVFVSTVVLFAGCGAKGAGTSANVNVGNIANVSATGNIGNIGNLSAAENIGMFAKLVNKFTPKTSDKILKSNIKFTLDVPETDMFGVKTVRKREMINKEPLISIANEIYKKTEITGIQNKHEMIANIDTAKYANVDEINRVFSRCFVKAEILYDDNKHTSEFPGGENAFKGTCEPKEEPFNDLKQFFSRNKEFGYDIKYSFPTPYPLLKKEKVPELVTITFTDSNELRNHIGEFEKSYRELRKLFPLTVVAEKTNGNITPEIIFFGGNEKSAVQVCRDLLKTTGVTIIPRVEDAIEFAGQIVLEGALFGDSEDSAMLEEKLTAYLTAYPEKAILLLAQYYLSVANNSIVNAEQIIETNEKKKVEDFYHGATIKDLFASTWPDYYRAALENGAEWIYENTDYDQAELEKLFFKRIETDKRFKKGRIHLDNVAFIERNYPEVVIYLLTNDLLKPSNSVEIRIVNTFNYLKGYDYFASLHYMLLFNIR